MEMVPTTPGGSGESKTGERNGLARQSSSSPLREYLGMGAARRGSHHPDFSGRKALSREASVDDDSAMLQRANSYNLRLQEIEDEETTRGERAFAECCENTALGILCASCVQMAENGTKGVCNTLYSGNWNDRTLRKRLHSTCWYQCLLFGICALIGLYFAPLFANSSAVVWGISALNAFMGHNFVKRKAAITTTRRREKNGKVRFTLVIMVLLGPTFLAISWVTLLETALQEGAWTFWAIVEVSLWVVGGLLPSIYSFLLLLKIEIGEARQELGNDLLTTSETIKAGLLAVARTTDTVLDEQKKELKEMVEAGAIETNEIERLFFELCDHLDVNFEGVDMTTTGFNENPDIDGGSSSGSLRLDTTNVDLEEGGKQSSSRKAMREHLGASSGDNSQNQRWGKNAFVSRSSQDKIKKHLDSKQRFGEKIVVNLDV